MMPRAASEVFQRIEGDASHHHTVFLSYIQIYMELLQARMHPPQDALRPLTMVDRPDGDPWGPHICQS